MLKEENGVKRLILKQFNSVINFLMTNLGSKITQEELAEKAGVGLRFVRDLEQGKATLLMDKVNNVLLLNSRMKLLQQMSK
jgi:predicted transcriptional regulator